MDKNLCGTKTDKLIEFKTCDYVSRDISVPLNITPVGVLIMAPMITAFMAQMKYRKKMGKVIKPDPFTG